MLRYAAAFLTVLSYSSFSNAAQLCGQLSKDEKNANVMVLKSGAKTTVTGEDFRTRRNIDAVARLASGTYLCLTGNYEQQTNTFAADYFSIAD